MLFVTFFHDSIGMNHTVVVITIIVILLFRILTTIIIHKQDEVIHELEEFIRVCAWCKHVKYEDKWMRFEEWSKTALDKDISHSICPECKEKQYAQLSDLQK